MNTTEKIQNYLRKGKAWQTESLLALHALIHEAYPKVEETWKWNSPVYAKNGKNICSLGCFASHLSLTFFHGHLLEDPHRLFRSSTDAKKLRSFVLRQDDSLPFDALRDMLRQAFAK